MGETQRTIGAWMDATFPGTDPESPRKALRALEEMVELCLAAGAGPRDITAAVDRAFRAADAPRSSLGGWAEHGHPPEWDKVPVEAADVAIVLYGLAHMRGFDLHAAVDAKMAVNRGRTWRANGDGTGYHVKATEAS